MQDLSGGELLLYAIIALVVFILFIRWIIAAASRSKAILRENMKQTKLLEEIARQQGVSDGKIEGIHSPKLYEDI